MWIWLAKPGILPTGAVLLLGLGLVVRPRIGRREVGVYVLAAGVSVSAIDYFAWRFGVTNWDAWWIALPLLGAELLGAAHALGLQYTIWPRQPRSLSIVEDPTHRPVFILIPTVN